MTDLVKTTLTRIILPKRVINISNYLNSLRNSLVKKKLNLILNQNLQYPHTPKKETTVFACCSC